ncbi:hypothetical protein PHAVU_010G075302 [Phaseolus vulgaris]
MPSALNASPQAVAAPSDPAPAATSRFFPVPVATRSVVPPLAVSFPSSSAFSVAPDTTACRYQICVRLQHPPPATSACHTNQLPPPHQPPCFPSRLASRFLHRGTSIFL